MSTVMQNAVKGQRKAMELLYEANKKKVYYVSLLLLGDATQAAEAASFAFKTVWDNITAHGISTEDEFTHLVIRKAVDDCKRKTLKQNPKAFRTPYNRNFLIIRSAAIPESSNNMVMDILNRLPALQRFICVLHTAGEYTSEQIASAFKFDMKTTGIALGTEEANIERAVQHLGENRPTYASVLEAIRHGEQEIKVPAAVDEKAAEVINDIAAQLEKKKKKRTILTSAVAAVLCCVLPAAFSLPFAHQTQHLLPVMATPRPARRKARTIPQMQPTPPPHWTKRLPIMPISKLQITALLPYSWIRRLHRLPPPILWPLRKAVSTMGLPSTVL